MQSPVVLTPSPGTGMPQSCVVVRSGLWVRRVVVCLLACVPVWVVQAAQPLSLIRVQGNAFVNAQGETVVFRGLNTSDPDKLAKNEHWNREYFEQARAWGANVVRIPVHPEAWRLRGRDSYLKLLDEGVAWAG